MISRRSRLDLQTPAEHAIRAAMAAVEALPPHVLLTEAGNLLDQARHKVADYVDRQLDGCSPGGVTMIKPPLPKWLDPAVVSLGEDEVRRWFDPALVSLGEDEVRRRLQEWVVGLRLGHESDAG